MGDGGTLGPPPFWGEVGVIYTLAAGGKDSPVPSLPTKFRYGAETELPLRPRTSQCGRLRAHGRLPG